MSSPAICLARAPRSLVAAKRASSGSAPSKQPRVAAASRAAVPRSDGAASPPPAAETSSCFACPICAGAMIRRASSSSTGGGALACALGHSFDVAKDGHVNLMMVGRVSRATGDTAEMLAARRRFLNAGHYTDASNVANALIARALDDFFTRDTGCGEDDREESKTMAVQSDDVALTPRRRRIAANKRRSRAARAAPAAPPPLVVDFGCGEGWWLARAIDAAMDASPGAGVAPGKMKKMKKIAFAALDASPAAARLAARILPPDVAEVAVADATGAATPLPLADASVAVALSVFAPRRPSELVRVLGERGVVVVVSPGDDHLAELRERGTREALGVLDVAGNKRGAVAKAFVAVGFVAEAEERVAGSMALNLADLRDVVGMGPSAFHGTEESAAALETFFEARAIAGEDGERRVRVTKSFVVQCFRKPLER